MAGAKLERTRWPGIYRRGDRWAYEWTDTSGKRRRGSADTREQASTLKAAEEARAAQGEHGEAGLRSRLTLAAYALDLYGADSSRAVDGELLRGRYQGRRGAIRDSTLKDYRRHIERTWLPALGDRELGKITAPDIARVIAALAARSGDDYLADSTLRRTFAPLAALTATAAAEGVIPQNVARDVKVPTGRDRLRKFDADDQDDGDDPSPGKARALTQEQLDAFLLVVDPRWRLLFTLLAATGLRISEALALRWGDLKLDGNAAVRVRRAYVRGVYGPPKSKHGRRDVPLSFTLTRALRERRSGSEWHGDRDLVFTSMAGTAMDAGNLFHRTLKPAAQEAGAGWAGFHAFRHHCASALIADGRNVLQVSRWLGHHSPSFTLDVYAHLMDDGVGQPLDIGAARGPLMTVGVDIRRV